MLVLVAAQLGLLALVAASADAVTAARWYLRNSNTSGVSNIAFNYGDWGGTMTPVVGDWDNNGTSTPGMFDTAGGSPANWHLRNFNSAGPANIFREYGLASGKPVIGNWKCEGDQTNVYKDGAWYLRQADGGTEVQNLGSASTNPLIGDSLYSSLEGYWCDRPAVQNPSNGYWTWDVASLTIWNFYFGSAGDIPLMGDWDGDGLDSPGIYRPSNSTFHLSEDDTRTEYYPLRTYTTKYIAYYGNPGAGWKPVAGDWNGDGIDTIGLVAPAP